MNKNNTLYSKQTAYIGISVITLAVGMGTLLHQVNSATLTLDKKENVRKQVSFTVPVVPNNESRGAKLESREQESTKEVIEIEEIHYEVTETDTLNKIAKKFDTTVESIQQLNSIENINLIYLGQDLILHKNDNKKIVEETTNQAPNTTENNDIKIGDMYTVQTTATKGFGNKLLSNFFTAGTTVYIEGYGEYLVEKGNSTAQLVLEDDNLLTNYQIKDLSITVLK